MCGKQLGFSDYELTTTKKQTKREKFLSEIQAVVPWQALIALIELRWVPFTGQFWPPDIVNPGREEQGSASV
jgi:hypothetical protein